MKKSSRMKKEGWTHCTGALPRQSVRVLIRMYRTISVRTVTPVTIITPIVPIAIQSGVQNQMCSRKSPLQVFLDSRSTSEFKKEGKKQTRLDSLICSFGIHQEDDTLGLKDHFFVLRKPFHWHLCTRRTP